MVRAAVILVAAMTSAACNAGFMEQLMSIPPRYPDPTRMTFRQKKYPACFEPMVAAARDGQRAFTWTLWLRADPSSFDANKPRNAYTYPCVSGFFSTRCGISSREGAESRLVNLCTHDYDTPLTLTGGKWTKRILPTAYDDGGSDLDDWANGCYAVNIETDTRLTLTVGGASRTVTPADGKQVFNMRAESSDRFVTVQADKTTAVVKLAIAENPLVQFFGSQITTMDTKMSKSDFGGINADEYTLIVQRARINDDMTITTQISALTCDGEVWQQPETLTQKRPQATFSEDARLSAHLFALSGITNLVANLYGGVVYPEWLGDDMVKTIRDQDVRRMKCVGVEFPRLASNYWALTYSPKITRDDEEIITGGIDTTSGAVHEFYKRTVRTTKAAVMDAVPGVNNVDRFAISEIDLSCSAATAIVGNVVYFGKSGTFDVYGRDPASNVKTCRVTISEPADSETEVQRYTTDSAGWQKECNEAVSTALMSAESDGIVRSARAWSSDFSYQRVRAKRLYCLPTSSTAGTSFDKAVLVVSPHVFTTANHYGYVHGGAVTYTAPDGTESTAYVEGGDFYHGAITSTVSLASWARKNGFTAAEVAAANIGDIAVGVFTNGAIDATCCPWFMSQSTASNHFYTARVMAWAATQTDIGYGVPVSIKPNGTNGYDFCEWLTANTIGTWTTSCAVRHIGSRGGEALYDLGDLTNMGELTRIRERGRSMPNGSWLFPRTYPGDSGGGVYLDLGGKLVRVSHGHRAGYGYANGPSYVKGFKILKAFVESVGDELKTVE